MASTTLLTELRGQVVVDIDSNSCSVAERHTDATHKFCDMTSNQAIVYSEAIKPEQKGLLRKAIELCHTSETPIAEDQLVDHIIDYFTVLLAQTVYPYLTGRVHAQTSPAFAYNMELTIAHARRLVTIYEANGIPKSRVCIKIPSTPESLLACQYLQSIGIDTLATCLFSVAQAVAASQAGCLYIAPYFNELRVHFEPTVWREYNDTVSEHPMAIVIQDIIQSYKDIGSKTLVMPASIVTAAEVSALVGLGPDHLTLSATVLDQLSQLPASSTAKSKPEPPNTTPKHTSNAEEHSAPPSQHPDYLAASAIALRHALQNDTESTRKLADALSIFGEMENKLRTLIQAEIKQT